jgi:hypothetical protein
MLTGQTNTKHLIRQGRRSSKSGASRQENSYSQFGAISIKTDARYTPHGQVIKKQFSQGRGKNW